MPSDPELRYWLALAHAPAGLGPQLCRDAVALAGSAQALFEVIPSQALSPEFIDYLRHPTWDQVERDMEWAASAPRRQILHPGDPRYPSLLAETRSAPLVLYVLGDAGLLNDPQLAMVGSRNPTPSGAETAYEFARHLVSAGLSITSGLALGIDAASHRGALDGGGHTIAVAGTGLDRVYPARHRDLAHAIAEHGALVSEFAPGTPPLAHHFPRRNRIISGMSAGTLVVEAALASGSLITARTAAEQGREVFAIPGSIHSPLSRGCHQLIRQGAKLVETAADVLEELAPQLRDAVRGTPVEAAFPNPHGELDQDYQRLLNSLDFTPAPVDLLVERSGLTAEVVSSMLLVLELQGLVSSAPGGRYARSSKRA